VVGVFIAVLLATLLDLNFSLSAGVIAMLSLLDTRKKTFILGLKRLLTGIGALFLGGALFELLGYNVAVLSLFLLLLMVTSHWVSSAHSIIGNFVLVGHIYSAGIVTLPSIINEFLLLAIGVIVGFALTLHMPNDKRLLDDAITYIEDQYQRNLLTMAHNLHNFCFVEFEPHSLDLLEKHIKQQLVIANRYNENIIWKKADFYKQYFAMRLSQVYRLMYMRGNLSILFVAHEEALVLSELTEMIANRITQDGPVDDLLQLIDEKRRFFKTRPLPQTRELFECRATLFQYLKDLEEFINIKKRYLIALKENAGF
jgi:uncharacterized membrane protein YgaE (UPF0421/DUF939 family)